MTYKEGTKLELKHWDSPDHMHRTMMMSGVAINWHSQGDPVKDPDNYTESFDVVDNYDPSNSREGLTRAEVDDHTWGIYWDEQCR